MPCVDILKYPDIESTQGISVPCVDILKYPDIESWCNQQYFKLGCKQNSWYIYDCLLIYTNLWVLVIVLMKNDRLFVRVYQMHVQCILCSAHGPLHTYTLYSAIVFVYIYTMQNAQTIKISALLPIDTDSVYYACMFIMIALNTWLCINLTFVKVFAYRRIVQDRLGVVVYITIQPALSTTMKCLENTAHE